MEVFRQRLESLRGGKTQRDFAKSLGIPLTTYTNWINGVSSPKAEAIISICSKLGVSSDWLLGISTQKNLSSKTADELKISAMKGAIQAILDKF